MNSEKTSAPELTREESAFFVKTFWSALQTPNWPRSLLIEFGTLVHEKTPLAKFNEAQLTAFLPKLREIATAFQGAIARQIKQEMAPTKEEIAGIIRILWTGLISPDWTRDDLIELGKSVFSKTKLASLNSRQFEVLFPYLTTIANQVGIAIFKQPAPTKPAAQPVTENPSAPESPSPVPAPSPITKENPDG